ncbi:MAG TPA: hypothetical protein VMF13_00415, partial [Luteitalea sp.]|nr:hypothetical protein [Luteitalea sp.]
VAQTFGGGALIVGPSGDVLAAQTDVADGLTVADLSRESQLAARSAFEYTFRFRRPELYGLLANS